jgi:uncharacterized glyoxalase superfamily protein PhnB
MKLHPHLSFDGQCEAAFQLYAGCFQSTFWAARFGVLIDQFGVPWEINCEQVPQPPPLVVSGR